jgi:hypothetical protein
LLGATSGGGDFGGVSEVDSAAAHCLKLPGKQLNLTALLYAKKFRAHGYKTGAQAAFDRLVRDGLGTQEPPLEEDKSKGKSKKVFTKLAINTQTFWQHEWVTNN